MSLLENMTWQEAKEIDWSYCVAMLPLGSFEQHGPHLPLTVDTDIVTAIARHAESERPENIVCLPTLWLGHSTHHLAFAGTLSTMQSHYIANIVDLSSSIASAGAKRIFFLNGHGGNEIPVKAAMREIKSRLPAPQPRVVFANYWSLAAESIKRIRKSEPGGLGHACEMETSVMLHLHPDRVHMERAKRDGPTHQSPYRKADMQYSRPVYFVNEFNEISETGTVGHPELATAKQGKAFLDAIVRDTLTFIEDFLKW